jgi:hypothetical protein
LRRAALALFDLTQGAIKLSDFYEMDLGELPDWLEDAVDFRKEVNKAQARG